MVDKEGSKWFSVVKKGSGWKRPVGVCQQVIGLYEQWLEACGRGRRGGAA